jgi:hypothetical protein
MGKHRDNFTKDDLKTIYEGGSLLHINRKCKGAINSQVPGTNVIVFTRGNRPMSIQFSFPPSFSHLQCSRDSYVTTPAHQFELNDGWISILDPIDDILMVHEVYFVNDAKYNLNEKNSSYRISWVMRWLSVTQDYFTKTCGLRRTETMLRNDLVRTSPRVDDMYPSFVRDIYS